MCDLGAKPRLSAKGFAVSKPGRFQRFVSTAQLEIEFNQPLPQTLLDWKVLGFFKHLREELDGLLRFHMVTGDFDRV